MKSPTLENSPQNITIYQADNGALVVDVRVSGETLWLSLNQMAELFERDKSVISKHLKNIFTTAELKENSVVANFATTAADGKVYQVDYFNLDAIISVGYRVNSKRGTQFRQWASQVLKEHLIQGYTINQKQITQHSIQRMQQTLSLLSDTLIQQQLVDTPGQAIIQEYAKTWDLLLRYDENHFTLKTTQSCRHLLAYAKAKDVIEALKRELQQNKNNVSFFGQERDHALQAIFGNLDQTFDSTPVYPSCEERAAHLLYFIIKDHPFSDGNKRIASLLFLIQLKQDGLSLQKMNDTCLTALTLLVAQSHPQQKDMMIQLIMSLLQS